MSLDLHDFWNNVLLMILAIILLLAITTVIAIWLEVKTHGQRY